MPTHDNSAKNFNADTTCTITGYNMSASAGGYLGVFMISNVETHSSVTWNGVNMVKVHEVTATGNGVRGSFWHLYASLDTFATGANNIVGTCGASTNIALLAFSATGCHLTSPVTNHNTAPQDGSTTTPTITIGSSGSELVYSCLGMENGLTTTVDASWTQLQDETSGARRGNLARITGSASVTRTDTLSGAGRSLMMAVSLQNPAGGGTIVPVLMNSHRQHWN